jgi:hypothetical protein
MGILHRSSTTRLALIIMAGITRGTAERQTFQYEATTSKPPLAQPQPGMGCPNVCDADVDAI